MQGLFYFFRITEDVQATHIELKIDTIGLRKLSANLQGCRRADFSLYINNYF